MDTLYQDLRYAVRQLRRNPAFATAAALTLALGIAATATVFSFLDAALLRPLPYPEPGRLMALSSERADKQGETLSYPNFVDYRDRSTLFERMAMYRRRRFNVTSATGPERVQGAIVSTDFFRVLAVAPSPGRDFRPDEDHPGQDQVAVVSDRFWRRHLGADPAAIGRTVRVDGAALAVIGVVPAGLGFPRETDIWLPISHEAQWLLESRGLQGYLAVGRLRAGASAEAAQQQMATIAAALAAEYPHDNEGWTIRLEPLQRALSSDMRPTLYLLFGSSAILMLIAAVNLANMQLARASGRQREIALRRAVGAGEARLIRQLLTENLVLAGLGGALGVAGAVWGVRLWQALWTDPSGSPALAVVNWRVVAFAAGAAAFTGLAFGLAPAIRITRGALADMLRQGGGATVRLRRTGRVLVASEIGLALVLGVGGCLLARSLLRLQAVDPGFDPSGMLTARLSLPEATYKDSKDIIAFYQRLVREVAALPGVEAAAAADAVPMIPGGGNYGFAIQGRPAAAVQEWPVVASVTATPDYFRTMSIRLLSGRLFDARDNASVPDVAVVNRTMARLYWPGRDPVGSQITFEAGAKHWIQVVGVVSDMRNLELGQPAEPQVFLAHAQWGDPALSLVVRSAGDPLLLVRPIEAVVHRLDPELPLAEARSMDQALSASITPQRLRTVVFGGFAALALLLAGVGIYGVIAYLVAQREREIAVRMALGARSAEVVRGVIGHSLRLAAPGVALGLGGALVAAQVMRGFLYEVAPTDPLSLLFVSAGVAALVAASALVPARKAARTDPMTALRND